MAIITTATATLASRIEVLNIGKVAVVAGLNCTEFCMNSGTELNAGLTMLTRSQTKSDYLLRDVPVSDVLTFG